METPPHAWGRLVAETASRLTPRNTPTCVGKTCSILKSQLLYWKHPHMRGEDVRGSFSPTWNTETPPHAWGRPLRKIRSICLYRNTPTCVGKTIYRPCHATPPEKHPHMRGEDRSKRSTRESLRETPPHAWGRRNWTKAMSGYDGNTPTCVGKTRYVRRRIEEEGETPPHAWGRP